MGIIASPDVLRISNPRVYEQMYGAGSSGTPYAGAVGGYGSNPPTTGNGMPTTGIPPEGGYPWPYNTLTGGVGYNVGPGGYQTRAERGIPQVMPSAPIQPKRLQVGQTPMRSNQNSYRLPTGLGQGMYYKPAYGAYQ